MGDGVDQPDVEQAAVAPVRLHIEDRVQLLLGVGGELALLAGRVAVTHHHQIEPPGHRSGALERLHRRGGARQARPFAEDPVARRDGHLARLGPGSGEVLDVLSADRRGSRLGRP